jgi:hypothetical protein
MGTHFLRTALDGRFDAEHPEGWSILIRWRSASRGRSMPCCSPCQPQPPGLP